MSVVKKHKGWIALGITAGIVGLACVVYKIVNKKVGKASAAAAPVPTGSYVNPSTGQTAPSPGTSSTNVAGFPLSAKNSTYNTYVVDLQQALVNRYGSSILPKYGVDGKFGSETQAALQRATGKTSVATYADFQAIVNSLNAGMPAATTTVPPYVSAPSASTPVSGDYLMNLIFGNSFGQN